MKKRTAMISFALAVSAMAASGCSGGLTKQGSYMSMSVESNGIGLRMLATGTNSSGQETATFSYSVTPSDTTDSILSKVDWKDPAGTDDAIGQFLKVSSSDDSRTMTVTKIADFSHVALATVYAKGNESVSASVTLGCMQRFVSWQPSQTSSFFSWAEEWHDDMNSGVSWYVKSAMAPKPNLTTVWTQGISAKVKEIKSKTFEIRSADVSNYTYTTDDFGSKQYSGSAAVGDVIPGCVLAPETQYTYKDALGVSYTETLSGLLGVNATAIGISFGFIEHIDGTTRDNLVLALNAYDWTTAAKKSVLAMSYIDLRVSVTYTSCIQEDESNVSPEYTNINDIVIPTSYLSSEIAVPASSLATDETNYYF